jgi:hypothetical protein
MSMSSIQLNLILLEFKISIELTLFMQVVKNKEGRNLQWAILGAVWYNSQLLILG